MRGNGKMRKNVLKMGAALMAAVMVAATPMTVKAIYTIPTVEAVNGIADQTGCYYEIPSINGDFKPVTVSAIMGIDSEPYVEEGQLYVHGRETLAIPFQAGYELRGCYVRTDSSYNNEWTWYLEGEGCTDFEIIKEPDDPGFPVTIYNFSATDVNGVYPDCKFIISSVEPDAVSYDVMAPKDFTGWITFTVYAKKIENDKLVKDESSYLKFYLWGDAAAAQQPTPEPEPTEQPAPAPEPTEQPAPAPETAEHPAPTTSSQGTIYVTKSGDNLKKIAKEVYGDRNLWEAIYELNKEQIKNPNIIYANMHLILP